MPFAYSLAFASAWHYMNDTHWTAFLTCLPYVACPIVASGTLCRVAAIVGIKYSSHKSPLGHCKHCGYNLTGNVTGICPECGKPVPPTIPDSSKT